MLTQRPRDHAALGLGLCIVLATSRALAQEPPQRPKDEKPLAAPDAGTEIAPPAPAPDAAASAGPTTASAPVQQAHSEERAKSVVPHQAAVAPAGRTTLSADPIADGAIIAAAAGFAGILDLINSTGELRPQQIAPNFTRSQLLGIDRAAISQDVDTKARNYSNIGLYAVIGYAVLDPVLSGIREKSVQTGLVDAIIYAEAITITWGVTNLAKMAVRRPRPQAYIDAELHKDDPNYSNSSTDSALSFFSGHSSIAGSVTSTATYLAFVRSPHSPRPWITLGVGTALTSFIAIERVRSGAHFPTDVIAGAIAGAGIGVVVAHLHRSEDVKQRRIWVGYAPDRTGGGQVQVSGAF